MSNVEEIERAIEQLPPEEFARIARRVLEIEQQRWDEQLDKDAAAGRLHFLREEARKAREEGTLEDWPPSP